MTIKISILKMMLLVAVAAVWSSCTHDNDIYNYYEDVSNINGGYILNSGKYQNNNATLSFYNLDKDSISTNIFEAQNSGTSLGDTGEDMIIYGNKMYIGMYGSNAIYVTDRNGKLINTITKGTTSKTLYPRAFAAYGKYVYVTLYDGYVARIDTTNTTKIDDQLAVGNSPEGIAVSKGNLFVANSGGANYPNYDSTVTVINSNTFKAIDTLKVKINPTVVQADDNGNVYVVSMGNYATVPNTLQRINSNYSVDSLTNATMIALSKDQTKIYYVYSQYDSNWNLTSSYHTYNLTSGSVESNSFVNSTVSSAFSYYPFSISVNPKTGYIYIGMSNYKAEGKMYVINPSTTYQVTSFSTGGINPMGIYFLVK